MNPESNQLFIGMMSGTSVDGVDVVLADFSAMPPRLIASHTESFPPELRQELLDIQHPDRLFTLQEFGELDHRLGELYASATVRLLEKSGIPASKICAIGNHGQTLFHHPEGRAPFSLQVGDGNLIAERTGITTVNDFRRRDMAAGGQGAPLAPAFHAAAFGEHSGNAVLNIGGIANVTLLSRDNPTIGFDTGPGNILLDLWAGRALGEPMDRDGRLAATGTVAEEALGRLLDDPYFVLPAPKSTGREYFNEKWLDRHVAGMGSAADVAATLVELTAVTIASAINDSAGIDTIAVCGGGARNPYLMERLAARMPAHRVVTTDELGVPAQWMEALAFAWLARQTVNRQPGNLPAVTGASAPVVLGAMYPGRN